MNDLARIRQQYPQLMHRAEALRLCRELRIGNHTFKAWCRCSPVPGLVFRQITQGYKVHHYRRETILAAAGLLPDPANNQTVKTA